NKNKCIGCGACAATYSEIFHMEDDGKAGVKSGVDAKKNAKSIKEAIKNCPAEAISN
ncbi:ferredoxin, partial [Candidatus Pacearchaeota archaeon]|nr:ferredoxin [Candidatus Pacearchaeota archaeon]HOF44354.1 ferredoxin [Candidatus Pacearchaeota archaeon]HOU79563.1 ferredoxin [Candidatus Pacearchaeota archaeon]HQF83200.1 ferredoxin [Candidatus Pacearchaeota archaeon]HQI58042.1 ferredoxin [Candidatus Pacearchaeota archaeon]